MNIYKLARLPRHQMLRKLCRLFTEAERRISAGSIPPREEIVSLADLALIAGYEGPPEYVKNTNAPDLRFWVNGVRHRLLAETGHFAADWDFMDHDGKLDPARRSVFCGMRVYLEDIRSPFNVGAMFRSAESFGAERIYLSPFCADPLHPRARRTAMGCIDILPWERCDDLTGLPPPCFALETGGVELRDFLFPRRGVLIAGSEELGVSPAALKRADASAGRVTIPHYGAKASLNVSAAFAIVMQAWAETLASASR
ncbi:MAG: TrmH family RNA methyltransferase [Treponema sp.]|nr:TrmH family RNA methyltransferase [Treponema sp.]